MPKARGEKKVKQEDTSTLLQKVYLMKKYLDSEVLECRHKVKNQPVDSWWYTVVSPMVGWNFSDYEFRLVPVKDYDEVYNNILVMLAYNKGETILRMDNVSTHDTQVHEWVEDSEPIWDFISYKYRIKQ